MTASPGSAADPRAFGLGRITVSSDFRRGRALGPPALKVIGMNSALATLRGFFEAGAHKYIDLGLMLYHGQAATWEDDKKHLIGSPFVLGI